MSGGVHDPAIPRARHEHAQQHESRVMVARERSNETLIGWSRRRVLVAGAWSVPVITAAVAVPSAAASGEIRVTLDGATDDAATYVFASPTDALPLIFHVSGTGPIPAQATASLGNATGIATWDESVLLSGDSAVAAIDPDGTLILPISALAAGMFLVLVHVGSLSRTFVITLEQE